MALLEGCKHRLEITVPWDAVEEETTAVVESLSKKVKLPGFRPGKVPASLIRKQFSGEVRRQTLDRVLPKFLQKRVEEEELKLVGTPNVTDVKMNEGEPLEFTVELEVAPEIELGEYTGIEVPYADPEVSDEDVAQRVEEIRQKKAEFVNIDPRPLEDGDFAVLDLKSVNGPTVEQNDVMLEIGSEETVAAFSEHLRGVSPGEEREFDVTYPEDYGQQKLAGQTVRFQATVKGLRRKELPELNDDFAQDVGDFQNLEELREEVRRAIFAERQSQAQAEAKNKLVEALVDRHEFPVPDAYVDQQIRNRTEQSFRALAAQGVDISKLNPDWEKLRESQKDKAIREVKASLLLGRIAERESIAPTREEVDREVDRFARQQREPFAAVRLRMEKEGTLGRIASHIQTEKVLSFLFERATKVAG